MENFKQAYQGFADQWVNDFNIIPQKVKDYIDELKINYQKIDADFVEKACNKLKYTIHETVNQTAMFIPTELHQKISHFGELALYGSRSKMPETLKNKILEDIKR